MTKTIVTGVDMSQTALWAAERAAELAEGLGAELYVFSAYSTSTVDTINSVQHRRAGTTSSAAYRELTERQAQSAHKAAEDVANALRESYPNLTVVAAAVEGTPAEVLIREAERLKADTIVVGNKRVQGLARVLGSVASKVASETHCDLLIVNTTQR